MKRHVETHRAPRVRDSVAIAGIAHIVIISSTVHSAVIRCGLSAANTVYRPHSHGAHKQK